MSTPSQRELLLAGDVMTFVGTLEAWLRRVSQESAGESVARLKLLYELHCSGPQKMADLAERLAVTPRNVTALVDGLEAEDQVRRVPHPTDRRITMIELTGGAAAIDGQMEQIRARVAALFEGLDPRDLDALARVMAHVGPRVTGEERTPGG